jgi:hypothetical protein
MVLEQSSANDRTLTVTLLSVPGCCCCCWWLVPVGVEADAADVERLFKELEGKDIKELIAAGMCVR